MTAALMPLGPAGAARVAGAVALAPLLAAGVAPTPLEGEPLDPPARLELRAVHRADEHLFMHYVPAP